jgi:NAD+ diphosphatase
MDRGSGGGAYLFQGNNLIVPEGLPDSQVPGGIGEETVKAAFGDIPWHEIPAIDGESLIPGFMLEPDRSLPPSWRPVPLRGLVSFLADRGPVDGNGVQGRLLRAYHILQWWRDSAYCGSCGGPNGDAPAELARLCPACGRLEYPRISPAIIVLIIADDGRALLAHNRKFTNRVYSLIAGFTEAGENLEAAVAREVREEVGLQVKNTRYEASQPWPFPNSLMIGFTTRYAGGTIRPDGEEIVDAQWFRPDKLPELPGKGSVSRFLIDAWLEGRFRRG